MGWGQIVQPSSRAIVLVMSFFLGLSCGRETSPLFPVEIDSTPLEFETLYQLSWKNHPIGSAKEALSERNGRYLYLRREEVSVLRDGVPVTTKSLLRIFANPDLRGERVEWSLSSNGIKEQIVATRQRDRSWVVLNKDTGHQKVVEASDVADLAVYRLDMQANARVLLPGYGFIVETLQTKRSGANLAQELETELGTILSTTILDTQGIPISVEMGSSKAIRSSSPTKSTLPDVISLTTIGVRGTPSRQIVLSGEKSKTIKLAPIRRDGTPFEHRLLQETAKRISPTLAAPVFTPSVAGKARGDCNAFAQIAVDIAIENGREAQLVTGYRRANSKLLRHRWIALKDGEDWNTLDPTYGVVDAAGPDYIPLLIHSPDKSRLADEIAYNFFSVTKAHYR